jgi:hypothetical protein
MSRSPLTPHVPVPLQEYASPSFQIGRNEEYPTVFIKDIKQSDKSIISEVYMIGLSVLNYSEINPILGKIYCKLKNTNTKECILSENKRFQDLLNKKKDDIHENITDNTHIPLFEAYKTDLQEAVIDLTTLVRTPEPLTDVEVVSTILMTHHNNGNERNGNEPTQIMTQVMTPLRPGERKRPAAPNSTPTAPNSTPTAPNSHPRPSQMPEKRLRRQEGGKSKKQNRKIKKRKTKKNRK